jgi:hypothetical protein
MFQEKKKDHNLIRIILAIFLMMSANAFANGLSVTPLYLEFKKDGRKKIPFSVKVESENAADFRISVYKATQGISGKLGFEEIPKQDFIEIKNPELRFMRKGIQNVEGYVNMSSRTKETHVFALMIEEAPNERKGGISIKVRYAVVLKVNTSRKRVYEKGIFNKLETVKSDENGLILKGLFSNQSSVDYLVNSKAYIRDQKGKLIETVDLKSMSSWHKKSKDSILFPGSKVELLSPLKKIKTPGTYSVTVLSKMNDKRTITFKGKIKLTKDDLGKSDAKKGPLEIEIIPSPIEMTLRSGKTGMYRMMVKNPGSSQAVVKFNPSETLPDGKTKFIKVFPSEMKVRSGQKKYVMLKVRNDLDKTWQPGKLNVEISNNGSNKRKMILPIKFNYK